MMLSMVPAVSAVEADATAEPETAVEEVVSKEDLDRQIEADQLADAAKLTDEEIAAREEARRARVDAVLAAAEISEDPILDGVQAMPEPAALGASTSDGEYTINVTLNFTSPAAKDTTIRINCFDNSGYFGNWIDVTNQILEEGETELDFSLKVDKGSYNLEFYGVGSSTGWMYADIYGALSDDWDNLLYIGAFGDDKTIDVVIDGDQLLKTAEEEEEVVGTDVKVTVDLPAKTTGETRYRTFLRSGNSVSSYTENVASGKTSYTENMTTTFSSFVVGYYDATNIDTQYNVRYASGVRYVAEDGGITSQFSEAKVFTASETSAVTIDDTNNYTMTGTLKLESEWKYDKGMYAFAEFEDGECYAGRAYFPAGETSAEYTIYIPKTQVNNDFSHWAAETEDWNSNRILEDSYLEGQEYTLTKSGSLADITLPNPPVTVSGTFSLPAGMKAPTGGLNVAICIEDQSEVYTLAAGKSSFDFELTPVIDEDEEYWVYAYVENAPDNLCDEFYVRCAGSELLDIDLTAYETVIVSGSLETPDECEEKGSTIRIFTHSSLPDDRYFNNNVYVTVLPGQTTAAYELKVLKGYEGTYVEAEVEADATGKLLSASMYLQEDGTVSEDYCWFALTEDLSDVDFVYGLGKSISGKITLDEGLSAGYYSGTVYARPTEGGDTYRTYFYFDGTEGSYSLAVPMDYTGTYRVYYYIYAEDEPNALSECQIYYSESGMTTDSSSAAKITVPETGVENIDLVVLKAKFITGTISAPAGMSASDYYSGRVRAQNTSTGAQYTTYFDFSGTQYTYSLGIPADEAGPLYVSIYMYDDSAEGVMIGEYCYWSESGMVFNRNNATAITPPEAGATVNLTIPKGLVASGNITIPSTLPADGDYYGRVYLVDENGNSYDSYFNFSEGTKSYSISLPADYTGTYNLYIYVYQSDETPEGLITYTNLYLQEDGTFSTSKDTAKDFTIGEAGLTQDIEIPVGQSFTVNMAAPAGFSGDYNGYITLYNVTAGTNTGKNFEFSGTSGSVSFTVPSGDTSEYALRINVYEGPGAMYNTYYYAEGGKWVSSQSNRTTFTTESGSLDITLPAGKVITGKLKSADGTTINLGTPQYGSSYGSLSLNAVSGSYISSSSVVNADGTFTITIPEDATGTHRIYFSPNSNLLNCNVVSQSYYYAADSTVPCTEYSSATAVDVSGEIPELTVYVETGYVLSGTVKLGEGATLTTSRDDTDDMGYVNIRLKENVAENEDGFYDYIGAYLTPGRTSWNYSVTVPKKAASYTLSVDEVRLYDDTSSNIYTGQAVISSSVSVSGSTTLPVIELLPAKCAVNVNIAKPASATSYSSGNVYVATDTAVYESEFSISSSESNTNVQITIPGSETASTYKLYYSAYSSDGIYSYRDFYLTSDGSLTEDETQAASFNWTKLSHSITMKEQPPTLTGKIYLPGYTDQKLSVYLSGRGNKSVSITPSTVKTDENGSKYCEYALYSSYASAGDSYTLRAQVSYDSSVSADNRPWANTSYYVNPDGSCVTSWSDVVYFTVPETITTTLDFVLADWETVSGNCVLQSIHNIVPAAEPVTYTYTYVYPDITSSTRMEIRFNNLSDMNVTINGEEYESYGTLYDVYTEDGTITVSITVPAAADAEQEVYYGFGITRIEPYYYNDTSYSYAVTAVNTKNGSDAATVMSDLRSGSAVHVTLMSPSTSGTAIAAIYDSNGKMLDVKMKQVTFSYNSSTFNPSFDNAETAATLKIMLLSNSTNLIPQMDVKTITG